MDNDHTFFLNNRKKIENCAKDFCRWRTSGRDLTELRKYQKYVDKSIAVWGRSIYRDLPWDKANQADFVNNLIRWRNLTTEEKTDEAWIQLFGKIFFNDVLEEEKWS